MPQDSYRDPRPVVLIVDEGSNPFELACACEVFGARRRPEIGRELYQFRVVTPRRRVAVRDAMFTIAGAGDFGDIDDAHTVIVPNRPDTDTPTHPAVIRAVQRAHQRGARLVGLCTGAYTLAEAGLLDGRPAAVHWQLAGDFRRRHPKVDLHPDVLFVDDGDILTSAGSAAALDLALHIVRLDHGAQTANFVSRRLVFSAFRDGGMANRRARRPGAPSHPSTAPASRVISPSCRAVAENALLDDEPTAHTRSGASGCRAATPGRGRRGGYHRRVSDELFVPEDFTAPDGLTAREFRLAPLGPQHNESD